MTNHPIELGDLVEDRVTGFRGIAVGRIDWIFGCIRWVVQPLSKKGDSKLEDGNNFDELALKVVKKRVVKRIARLVPVIMESGKKKRSTKDLGGPITIPITKTITR